MNYSINDIVYRVYPRERKLWLGRIYGIDNSRSLLIAWIDHSGVRWYDTLSQFGRTNLRRYPIEEYEELYELCY